MHVYSRLFIPCLALLAIAGCAGSAGSGTPVMPASQRVAESAAVSRPFSYSVHPRLTRAGDLLLHNCPGGTVCALTPTTLRTAYNLSYQTGVSDGTGQTIVIVDAYGSPTIQSDLTIFDRTVANLPDPPSFQVVYSGGKPSINLNNATQLGWAEETTLDVEWAHASAPGAKIILVVANNDQGNTIQAAQQYAIGLAPQGVLSLSFGVQEASINNGANNTQLAAAHAIYQQAASPAYNVTVIASAGDFGSSGGFTFANPQYPASDPFVLGVGGTNLTLFNNGKYRSESAWNDGSGCASPCGATGGAVSSLWAPFEHEADVTKDIAHRDVADVAYDASDDAVVVYIGFNAPGVSPGLYAIGGTSVGPPAYAGIVAIANQLRSHSSPAKAALGYINPQLYQAYAAQQASKAPPFHDVTAGNNIFLSGIACCPAGAGYDMPTGLGSPNVNNLLNTLVNVLP